MDGCVFFVASQPCLAVFGQEECSTFIHHHHHYFHSLSVRWSTKHISSTTSQGFNCWVGGRGRDFGRRPTVDHQGLSYIQESSRETRDEGPSQRQRARHGRRDHGRRDGRGRRGRVAQHYQGARRAPAAPRHGRWAGRQPHALAAVRGAWVCCCCA